MLTARTQPRRGCARPGREQGCPWSRRNRTAPAACGGRSKRPFDCECAMTDKAAKPASKRVSLRKPKPRLRKPTHNDISVRAYFMSLETPESDDLGNWLRAERELKAA